MGFHRQRFSKRVMTAVTVLSASVHGAVQAQGPVRPGPNAQRPPIGGTLSTMTETPDRERLRLAVTREVTRWVRSESDRATGPEAPFINKVAAKPQTEQRAIAWEALPTLLSGTQLRLHLMDGSEVYAKFVEVRGDSVLIEKGELREGKKFVPKRTDLLTFPRSAFSDMYVWPTPKQSWAAKHKWGLIAAGIGSTLLISCLYNKLGTCMPG